jgi:hypothetical protein
MGCGLFVVGRAVSCGLLQAAPLLGLWALALQSKDCVGCVISKRVFLALSMGARGHGDAIAGEGDEVQHEDSRNEAKELH